MAHRVTVIAAVLLALAVVVTPGSRRGDPPSISTPPEREPTPVAVPDPCALIPPSRIADALGMEKAGRQKSAASCFYGGEGDTPPDLHVQIVASPDGLADLAGARDLAVGVFGAGAITDVPDLGDGAFAATNADTTYVTVLQRQHRIVLALARSGDEALRLALDLARTAIGGS